MKLLFYILFLLCTITLFLSLFPPLSPGALCGAARQSGLCAVFWGIQLPAVYGYTFRPIKRLDRRFLFPGQEKYLDLTLLRHGIIAITVKTVCPKTLISSQINLNIQWGTTAVMTTRPSAVILSFRVPGCGLTALASITLTGRTNMGQVILACTWIPLVSFLFWKLCTYSMSLLLGGLCFAFVWFVGGWSNNHCGSSRVFYCARPSCWWDTCSVTFSLHERTCHWLPCYVEE